ncbi:MAG: hypothetical protein GY938_32695 [Ketobacter sp.]|nr:hypothetical protein [Ketobacter sp.]
MSTNQELIDQALSELGYHGEGASASTAASADALAALNNLMHEWKYQSRDLNWFTQDTLDDTAPVPKWALKGVISCLGMRLSTVFDITPTGQLVADARDGKKAITRTLININLVGADMRHLPQQGRYNIESDT